MTAVAVCIPTYRRPEFLADLLQSLTAMETDGLDVRVVVVDNDAAGSAEPVVRRFADRLPRLAYAVEPSRGLAAVRNRLVSVAAKLGVDYVAFVDDDERVEPEWLTSLVGAARRYRADAVAGPVLPVFDEGTPNWVVTGCFFQRQRFPTGRPVRIDATSNLLLSRAVLDGLDAPFDRRFDLISGEDTHLLERLSRNGAHMVWSDEAVVHEHIPLSRSNAGWLLRRAFRGGASFSAVAAELDSSGRHRLVRMLRATARLGYGLVILPPALPRGRSASVRALCHIATGAGGVLGLLGISYREYERIHGR